MSLIAIIFIAIVIPFVILFLGFTWFFIQSRIAKLAAARKPRSRRSSTSYRTRLELVPEAVGSSRSFSARGTKRSSGYKPTYKPLSHFLPGDPEVTLYSDSDFQEIETTNELSSIPGISQELAQGLETLGYSSIEQVARWGRADVRAVSADLGIDQQIIEEEWIANARLLLTIRSSSLAN